MAAADRSIQELVAAAASYHKRTISDKSLSSSTARNGGCGRFLFSLEKNLFSQKFHDAFPPVCPDINQWIYRSIVRSKLPSVGGKIRTRLSETIAILSLSSFPDTNETSRYKNTKRDRSVDAHRCFLPLLFFCFSPSSSAGTFFSSSGLQASLSHLSLSLSSLPSPAAASFSLLQ